MKSKIHCSITTLANEAPPIEQMARAVAATVAHLILTRPEYMHEASTLDHADSGEKFYVVNISIKDRHDPA